MDILERIDQYLIEFKLDYSVQYDKSDRFTERYIEIMNDMNKKMDKYISSKKKLIGQYDTILTGNKSIGGY